MSNHNTINQRNTSMDALRIIAILMVILLHIVALNISSAEKKLEFTTNYWVSSFISAFCRTCVPLFIMISGRYLLNREETPKEFYTKRVQKIIGPLLFWTLVYTIYSQYLLYQEIGNIDLKIAVTNILSGQPFYHMWFLYMILGLYLITPLFNPIFRYATNLQLWVLCIILFIAGLSFRTYFYVHPVEFNPFKWGDSLLYLGYFLVGYVLKAHKVRYSTLMLLLVFVICSLCVALFPYIALTQYPISMVWIRDNTAPLIVIASLSLYQLFNQSNVQNFTILKYSPLVLGIYLIHAGILDIWYRFVLGTTISSEENYWMYISIAFPLITALSLFLIQGFSKIPLLRKVI